MNSLEPDERAELERLRVEVAALRRSSGVPAKSRWRRILATVLIVLGSILLLPGTVALWLESVVTDTDRYVATVAPLAEDPDVQAAVAERITDQVAAAIDVESMVHTVTDGLADRGLDDRATTALSGLAGPMASGFESWLDGQVTTIVRSDAFAEAWTTANRAAHTQVVALLTGDRGGALVAHGDRVELELAPVIEDVQQRLVDRGVTIAERIPTVDTQIVIAESEHLRTAERAFALIDNLGRVPAAVAVLLLVAGVLVAPNRRRGIVGAGLGIVSSMLALAILLALARPLYSGALPEDVNPAAAGAVFDQVLALLRTTLRAVLVVGLAVTAVAILTGPSRHAVALRTSVRRAARTLDRRGVRQRSMAGRWLRDHKRAAEGLVVAVAVVTVVFWDYPSGALVGAVALVAMALVILVELLAAPEINDAALEDEHPEESPQ